MAKLQFGFEVLSHHWCTIGKNPLRNTSVVGFWTFVSEMDDSHNDPNDKYLNGNKTDHKGNSIFHYLARSNCIAMCREYFPWNQKKLAAILGKQNAQKNTLLHVAAMSGSLKDVFKIVQEKVQNTSNVPLHHKDMLRKRTERAQNIPDMFFHDISEALKKQNSDHQTFIAAALNSDIEEQDIIDILERLQELPKGFSTFKEICRSCDVRGNNLLHIAAKRSKCEVVSHLADKPIDEGKNIDGFNPLHIAVKENNRAMFCHILEKFQHRLSINDPTGDEETVLHIVAKQGNIELLEEIVRRGGDLAWQDIDWHTPLHDCLQQVYLEGGSTNEGRCMKFKNVWDKVVDVAVIWWCGPCCKDVPLPDEGSKLYQDYKRDALYCLRSLLPNKNGFSALQYAAYLGLVGPVGTMLTQEHVFVRRKTSTEQDKDNGGFEIEITNLSPEYEVDFAEKEEYLQVQNVLQAKLECSEQKTSFVETLAKIRPPLKASQVLACVPMFRLTTWQWKIYQWFGFAWLLCHLVIMSVASAPAQNEVTYNPSNDSLVISNVNTPGNSTNDTVKIGKSVEFVIWIELIFPLYATVIFVLFAVPLGRMIHNLVRRRSKKTRNQYDQPTYKLYHEYTEDKGTVLSALTLVMRKFVDFIQVILATLFFSFAWGQFILKSDENIKEYTWVKGVFLLFGWLLLLIPMRTYSKIYHFLSTLQSIIIDDMLPFVLFYLFITIAFSCAIQLQFRLLSTEAVPTDGSANGLEAIYNSLWKVIVELIVVTTGLETDLRNVQVVTDLFQGDNLNSSFVRLLLIAYTILSVIVLLNMLIAMMGTTMSVVMEREGTGWRQYQVELLVK